MAITKVQTNKELTDSILATTSMWTYFYSIWAIKQAQRKESI